MEMFLTIVAWLAGVFAFFILGMLMMFSTTAHGDTTEQKVISYMAFFLMICLVSLGISSLFFSSDIPSLETASNQNNFILWAFYIILLVSFFGWIFTPSKVVKENQL